MSKVWAVYIGKQDDDMGGSFSLYNIQGNHKSAGSTVTKKTLDELGITVILGEPYEISNSSHSSR